MKRSLCVVLIVSLSALAADPVAGPPLQPLSAIPEVTSSEPKSDARFALAVSSASLLAVTSSVVGGLIAVNVPAMCTKAFGAPKPMCGAAGVALAGAAQLAISLLVIPEVFRLSGDDPGQLRGAWWRWARWPALALALSAVALFAASAMETKEYASGQGVMMGSMAAAAVSGATVDVMGIIGVVKAAKEARKKGKR